MRRFLSGLVLCLVVVAGAAPAFGFGLDSKTIESFISSFSELSSQYKEFQGAGLIDLGSADTAATVDKWAKTIAENKDMLGVIEKNGFGLETWKTSGERILAAYKSLTTEEAAKGAGAGLGLEGAASGAASGLLGGKAQQTTDQTLEADKRAVAPFMGELSDLFS